MTLVVCRNIWTNGAMNYSQKLESLDRFRIQNSMIVFYLDLVVHGLLANTYINSIKNMAKILLQFAIFMNGLLVSVLLCPKSERFLSKPTLKTQHTNPKSFFYLAKCSNNLHNSCYFTWSLSVR